MRCGTWVGWIGLGVGMTLVVVKVAVGLKTGSRAVMADALYSIIDVVSAIMVIASVGVSRRAVDDEHPYGYGKIEFLAVTFVSFCIAAFAAVLFHRVASDVVSGVHQGANPMAAAAAAVSMIACLLVSRHASCVAARLGSPIIATHAEHNKVDAISSFAVLIGITLTWLGLGMVDQIVAIGEIFHILWVSYMLFQRGMHGLLDASTDPEQLRKIARIAGEVPGVVRVDDVRARSLGSSLWVELTVEVAARRRMHEVGRIRSLVRSELVSQLTRVANVMIDIRPGAETEGQG